MPIRLNETAVVNPTYVPSESESTPVSAESASKPSLRVLTPAEIAHNEAAAGPDVDAQGIPTKRGALAADPPLAPTDEFLAELKRDSDSLESATPQEVLKWAVDRFAPKFTMATAFGPEGMTIIHMLSEIAPETPIFNLETGYQFQETLDLREKVKERYGIEVQYKYPSTTVEEFETLHGGPLYKTDPNRCCFERKLRVLHRAASGWHAWASAIRRDQSEDRAKAPIVGWDKKFQLVKISPLANWTKKDVWSLISKENIPYNPLHDQGYPSIGCQACTRPVQLGEDERAGRWSGFQKTECGLHTSE
ncbi:phosphoadenylyl-sulfate reductase [Rhodopirellula europaea]|uniref:Adenosine 5'-phosphosulfate reductase n=2 Tax=Rhodopirellula europaea TaxID=1263866 RepID=M5S9S7_9BACT|nr:phosphoadenylyl-sulfate reductase [Rhodopirellula europaea]EMB14520.1 phosphoadenosine phosphosulfate reductase [Rhodopirellula europaea 6C]EMI28240.1 phosphoadenosine phosphosulfate reductase [Rhodopirellula europaea SH398]